MFTKHSRVVTGLTLGTGIVGLGLAGWSNLATAAPVPFPSSTLTATSTTGMVYTGSSASNTVRITLSVGSFYVDDSGPIKLGSGCTAVPGDATMGRCVAPKETNGTLKRFRAAGGAGNDTLLNLTLVGMIADGGSGNDTLQGSNTANDDLSGGADNDTLTGMVGTDNLSGGSGNDTIDGGSNNDHITGGSGDDTLHGGHGDDTFNAGFFGSGAADGADIIDGGPGLHDRVDYTNYQMPVTIDLINSGPQAAFDGADGERDDIQNTVEDADGSLDAKNFMIGNNSANRLLGGIADDFIAGSGGADRLFGGAGNDFVSSNGVLFDAPNDGAKDLTDGGEGTDQCGAFTAEGDRALNCETVG